MEGGEERKQCFAERSLWAAQTSRGCMLPPVPEYKYTSRTALSTWFYSTTENILLLKVAASQPLCSDQQVPRLRQRRCEKMGLNAAASMSHFVVVKNKLLNTVKS